MIRAILRKGMIDPQEPVPPEWKEGQELRVEPLELTGGAPTTRLDEWCQELELLTAELNAPKDWELLEAALVEADRQAKALVRRDMTTNR